MLGETLSSARRLDRFGRGLKHLIELIAAPRAAPDRVSRNIAAQPARCLSKSALPRRLAVAW